MNICIFRWLEQIKLVSLPCKLVVLHLFPELECVNDSPLAMALWREVMGKGPQSQSGSSVREVSLLAGTTPKVDLKKADAIEQMN